MIRKVGGKYVCKLYIDILKFAVIA